MVGVTHVALRRLLHDFGGFGLHWTEMCSASAVIQEDPRISPVFRFHRDELATLVCQIMGSKPETMAAAARRIQDEGFFGVDINMGCCVAAVRQQGAGAALLRDISRAAAIVDAVRQAVDIPLFVKLRSGWTDQGPAVVHAARACAKAGADALIVHPRLAPDRRTRPPQWKDIRAVCEAVDLPVFGNGNIFTVADAADMLRQTGCQGIALGRIAAARPWIAAEWLGHFHPVPETYPKVAQRMVELLWSSFPDRQALRLYRKFINYFAANFAFGHRLRSDLTRSATPEDLYKDIAHHLKPLPQLAQRPNSLLFAA